MIIIIMRGALRLGETEQLRLEEEAEDWRRRSGHGGLGEP
jgi:hypothetical protein